MLAAKIALLPVSLAVAGAAFVHAGSETGAFSVGPGTADRLGLDAEIAGSVVDGSFRAEMATRSAVGGGDFSPLPAPLIELARDSFAVDPLQVSSLRTIALGSVLQDDEERARRLMRLAARISKRDSITNLWLAQDYGQTGELERMIAAFDHALRTSERAREFAMTPVVGALASQQSYAPLGELLARRPEWEEAFWKEFVRNPEGVKNAANFLESSGIPLERIPEQELELLYANLKKARQYETLYTLATLGKGAQASSTAVSSGTFVTASAANPLGWTLRSRGNYSARVQPKTGELQIDARSGSFGMAADRVVRGGRSYRLEVTMVEAVPRNAEIELAVRCLDEGGEKLGSVKLGPGDHSGEATVAASGCGFAGLEISFVVAPGRQDAFMRFAKLDFQ